MSSVDGVGDPSHDKVPTYKQEFEKGFELFKDSLIEYDKAEEPHKKDQFKQVMDKALKIMNHSARGALNQDVQTKEKKLEDDYQAFLQHESAETRSKLDKDLSELEGKA